jgi:hypothetical protein
MNPSSLNPETSKKGGDVERVGSIDIGGVSVVSNPIPLFAFYWEIPNTILIDQK